LESDITAEEVEALARDGNSKARAIYEQGGKALGRGLATVINLLDPDAIYLAGSISHAADIFLPPAKDEMEQHLFLETVPIKVSSIQEHSGVLGAASLAFTRAENSSQ